MTLAATALAVGGMVTAALVGVFPVATASATTVATRASLRAEASAIAATIAKESTALYRDHESSRALSVILGRDRARESAVKEDVHTTAVAVGLERGRLATLAVRSYVDAGTTNASLALFLGGDPTSVATAAPYLSVADSQLIDTVDALRHDLASLGRALTIARAATATTSSALQRLHEAVAETASAIATEEVTLESVRGRLATLVAEEEAAQARAEAARAAAVEARHVALERAAARAAAARARSAAERAAAIAAAAVAAQAARAAAAAAAAAAKTPPVSGLPAPGGLGTAPPPPSSLSAEFAALAECESGGNYAENTGNGYYGAYQFALSTWYSLGETGLPSSAAPAVQNAAALQLYDADGWAPWPACSAMLGLGS